MSEQIRESENQETIDQLIAVKEGAKNAYYKLKEVRDIVTALEQDSAYYNSGKEDPLVEKYNTAITAIVELYRLAKEEEMFID
jgi:hypothetical protein